MSLTLTDRFKVRKKVSAEIKVEFFPKTSLTHYCVEVLGQLPEEAKPDELSEAQKGDAKERYQELTFYFKQMAETEKRGFLLDVLGKMQADPSGAASKIQSKLAFLFKRAEHKPTDGSEALTIGKTEFGELLSMMQYGEITELLGDYRLAVSADEEAAKNALTAARNGTPQ